MCGFVALVGADAIEPGCIERGLAAIRHRGPDGEGIWRGADGRAALGHARLAILDLSTSGAQPMRSADGLGIIVYNGETYNFRDLAERLRVPMRSRSDTEVIVELLRAHGSGAVPMLRGMFSFAYWDGEELLLARDRLGIKPLYYSEEHGRLAAASEIAGILAMRRSAPVVDGVALDQYLTYLYVPPPRTGISGVHELPPAHLLRWRPGGSPIVQRYWEVPSRASPDDARPERVRELLEDSVRVHLVSDAPVGVFLSGGLDSSSIVALAAHHYPGTLKTFNVTFGDEGKHVDERHFARQVATRFRTDHHEIHVEAEVAQILPEVVAHFGQPFGNPTAVLTYALSRATRTHVKVALAGDGGDEVLGGYPRYQGVRLAELAARAPFSVRRSLGHLLRHLAPTRSVRGQSSDRFRRFAAHSSESAEQMYYRWVSYLDTARKSELLSDRGALLGDHRPSDPYDAFARIRRRHSSIPMSDAAPLIDLESFLPCNVLAYGDRMSMAHGLEVRVPFCDHLLVESLAPLPLATKMPFGLQKGLFRWAMRRDLPAGVLSHRKIGFNPPIASWLRRGLDPIVEEYLSPSSVRARGVFNYDAVHSLHRDLGADTAHALWAILVAEAWMRWLERPLDLRPSGSNQTASSVHPLQGRS
jgi:asparagine synthase (glutamine-hydrolysing)